ncbi:uncharacterized protein LOC129761338 [Toxorhynchites rutilus septentrionalis]|uniref:uncharacterized protein LOC129761338 n=1 Tax=Toxorhynchites rutilus septentrionalis TaxID=329112 RepID=UPI00247A5587|nr:uncharacterized protein LOC129761338 [Toxorhynchites rutilus septentrionalis]
MIDIHIAGLLGTKKLQEEDYVELRSLVESITGHVQNLKFLNQQFTGVSELIVVHLIARALDATTKKQWESTIKRGELPTYENTIQFLKDHVSVLERCHGSCEEFGFQRPTTKQVTGKQSIPRVNTATTTNQRCEMCRESHPTFKCSWFNSLTVSDRLSKVKEKNVCFNCLRSGHSVKNCPSKKSCFKCNKRHHTMLHLESRTSLPRHSSEYIAKKCPPAMPNLVVVGSSKVAESSVKADNQLSVTAAHSNNPKNPASQVVLLTALVDVFDHQQRHRVCKALLDCGSQVSFITQSFVTSLGIDVEEVSVAITGIGSVRSTIKQKCSVHVHSKCSDYSFIVNCLVSPKITSHVPSVRINLENWELPQGLQLADPSFHEPSEVDMLIGMDWFYDIMKQGCLKLSDDLPSLHNSQLGWLVGGKLRENSSSYLVMHSCAVSVDPVEKLNQKFREVKSVSPEIVPSSEEQCETQFAATLPLKDNAFQLVDFRIDQNPADTISRGQSATELGENNIRWIVPHVLQKVNYQVETPVTLTDSEFPELKDQYDVFLNKYEELGHCREIDERNGPSELLKFIPHQAVQHQEFAKEIECIVSEESNHQNLNNSRPFLDKGLLQVGDRISNSQLPFEMKHPLRTILPKECMSWSKECENNFEEVYYSTSLPLFELSTQLYHIEVKNSGYPKMTNTQTCTFAYSQ